MENYLTNTTPIRSVMDLIIFSNIKNTVATDYLKIIEFINNFDLLFGIKNLFIEYIIGALALAATSIIGGIFYSGGNPRGPKKRKDDAQPCNEPDTKSEPLEKSKISDKKSSECNDEPNTKSEPLKKPKVSDKKNIKSRGYKNLSPEFKQLLENSKIS